ncbi:cold-shock protein [Streptomyces sp. NPDC006879]|uniref:cold-shock protein n=1 Tax=Streptomyces sp. NPDC006879 TaxID=3364767 RepID=UPI0036B84240
MSSRQKGFVQSYNREGGYGFIIPYGQEDPVYVEHTALENGARTLSEGQQVTFVMDFVAGRFQALHVRP